MITVHQLCKSYGTKSILTDINITFPAQRISSIIGPNGAGKSTLLMTIARLLDFTSGKIMIKEKNILDFSTNEYAKNIAVLRQSPSFDLRLTVEELIAFGRFPHSRGILTKNDLKIIDESIDFLSLQSLRKAYIDEISGGQRQMAFLAMAIAQQTNILLLDEPLNNLDMKHAVQIMQALRRLCDEKQCTVILVIHDINFAANYSDKIIAIKNGTVFFNGTPTEIMTEEKLKCLYEIDFEMVYNKGSYICNYFNPYG